MVSMLGFMGYVVSLTTIQVYRYESSHRQYVDKWAWLCLFQ